MSEGMLLKRLIDPDFIGPLKSAPKLITKDGTQFLSSTTIFRQSTTTQIYYPSYSDYHKNEFYSICISILTAAAFAVFIMWRWLRMKSDLKRALQEQEQMQQHERSSLQNTDCNQGEFADDISGTSNNGIRWPNNGGRYMLISNNREELQTYAATLINQLSNGEYRTPRQHQQMIDTARYCLQQLKLHARLTQHYRLQNNNSHYGRNNFTYNNYSTFNSHRNSRNNRPAQLVTSASQSLGPLPHNLPPAPPVSSTSLSTSENESNFLLRSGQSPIQSNTSSTTNLVAPKLGQFGMYEAPPAYESLLIKSSSLPSYCHLTDEKK